MKKFEDLEFNRTPHLGKQTKQAILDFDNGDICS